MVVDNLPLSSVNFAIPDFYSLIPKVPSAGRQFSGRTSLEEAERIRRERKTSERFPGACSRIASGLPTKQEPSWDGSKQKCQGTHFEKSALAEGGHQVIDVASAFHKLPPFESETLLRPILDRSDNAQASGAKKYDGYVLASRVSMIGSPGFFCPCQASV